MKLLAPCILFGLLASGVLATTVQSQGLPMSVHALDSMDGFRPVASNRRIVGDVTADLETVHKISTAPGEGILVNIPTPGARDNLFSDWEHGDIELELEFMMAKGSNAGVYLQGRYEIQMLDSWGVSRPAFSDAGGIYQRWDTERGEGLEGYEGHPPRMNVSRAPGLWQQFQIRFQAPRFDADGRKTANAKMVRVVHNGVVVHENVEVTGPTRAAPFMDEQPLGPVMIQGDHGPVAIRNIRYKRYQPDRVAVTDTRYRYAEGVFKAVPDFASVPGLQEGDVEGIDHRIAKANEFAMSIQGALQVPYAGRYRFQLDLPWITGDPHDLVNVIAGGALVIGDQSVIVHSGRARTEPGMIDLQAGSHPFELFVFKNKGWGPRSLELWVEGGGMPLHSLNAPGSSPNPTSVGSILVEPSGEPALIRGFVRHGGKKKTHTIAVGHDRDVHYTIDLSQGALLHAWKGDFIETTDMWHSRGQEQLAVPLGAVMEFSGKPTVARLAREDAVWPDSVGSEYTFGGYELDAEGHPSFRYTLGGLSVSDRLLPEQGGRQLYREIALWGSGDLPEYWVRIAEGREIRRHADDTYSVDDLSYYVVVHDTGGGDVLLRTTVEGQELLVPVSLADGETSVRYGLVW